QSGYLVNSEQNPMNSGLPASLPVRMLGELAIAWRGDPQQPNDRPPHHIDVAESGVRGDLLETSLLAFELTTRRLHPHLKHVLRWGCAHLSSEYALKVAHTHGHALGKILYRQFPLEMLNNPDLQLPDRHHLRSL